MMTQTIRRIEVVAHLEDSPDEELARARREAEAGDQSWAQWLDEYAEGAAMLLQLEVSVVIEEGGEREALTCTNRNIWVEDHAFPPKVEQQVAELAHNDFPVLAEQLRERGLKVGEADLKEMFVAVELGDDVVERLGRERAHKGEGLDSTPGLTSDVASPEKARD